MANYNPSHGNDRLTLRTGGEIVGSIPKGLPTFKPIMWDWDTASRLFMSALVIALIGFTEAITIAKRIATKSRQRLNINQELIGQGLAKTVGSFFSIYACFGQLFSFCYQF